MMKQSFIKLGVTTLFSLLCSAFLHAQVVTDERMFSFEKPLQVLGVKRLNYIGCENYNKTPLKTVQTSTRRL